MKDPKLVKFLVLATYGCALAIAWFNVELSAKGLAANGTPENVDWALSLGMFTFETCLSTALGTPAFWPVLLGSINGAVEGILDLAGHNRKYQIMAVGLLLLFVGGLCFATLKTYELDLLTTATAIAPSGTPTPGQQFKIYALVFGPEALMLGAGLASLSGGISAVQWMQITQGTARTKGRYTPHNSWEDDVPDLSR